MNQPLNQRGAVFSLLLCVSIFSRGITSNTNSEVSFPKTIHTNPKIQAAILLDVSNSMDGLIEQAKNQLWNMVSVLGKVKCADGTPQIEIALYEYGRLDNAYKIKGYVKKISGFTNDLDRLFRDLQALTTYGGEEYCGHVIYSSIDELNWDTSSNNYKVIFIAGNEDFLQGDISYGKACTMAKKKGVIVNTIYCGSKEQGVLEHWDLGAACGNGSFTNIDQEAKPPAIPTPYDGELITLNRKLTNTYIYYGNSGVSGYNALKQSDTVPVSDGMDPTKILKYRVVRSDKRFYNDSGWDLIDASEKDKSILEKVDRNTLADSLKNKRSEELKQIVAAKAEERKSIKRQIAELDAHRDSFIAAEKAKSSANPQTLGSEIEKIIKSQVKRFKMAIE